MKRLLLTCFLATCTVNLANAQTLPFDMSPERPADKTAAPPAPAPVEHPQPAAPVPVPALRQPSSALENLDRSMIRYVIPQETLSLTGESSEKSWGVFLTEDQAASAVSLTLTYQNSLVVAPETSSLTLAINNAKILNQPVQSSENQKTVTVTLPPGILRAGLNTFRLAANLRHRTDCTVQSTYELWTEVDPSQTFLTFSGEASRKFKTIDDIRAIGVDGKGRTSFNIVVPALDRMAATTPMLHLAEVLAVLANMPNQSVNISTTLPGEQMPGSLTVLLGTDEEFSNLPQYVAAKTPGAALAAFVDDPATGGSILRVRGQDWQAVINSVASLMDPLKRDIAVPRTFISSQTWRSPDIPLLTTASKTRLSELGVGTHNFSGRRLRTEFAVGVPSDFYAGDYGKATILLDAAYSEDVRPGSQINIYVNDNIAASLPITTTGGEILRHFPIGFTMRHFRPGANIIAIEAVLNTSSDNACIPGPTTPTTRFALFDTSEFSIPSFARIGRVPNLAGLSGTSFPYNRSDRPLPVVVNNGGAKSFSAAATLLARMSVAAGRPLELDARATANSAVNTNALFIGAIPQIQSSVLIQTGVSEAIRTVWSNVRGAEPEVDAGNTQAEFDQWRERLAGRGWRGQISSFDDWLNRTFNISLGEFSFYAGADESFTPEPSATLLVAQRSNPAGDGLWTLVTSPTDDQLLEGLVSLTRQDHWLNLKGHISTYKAGTDVMQDVPVGEFTFVATQPLSVSNVRLIIANWLSANVLSFSLLLLVVSGLLGIATSRLLSNFGRHR
ncbi:cellulose biosynthesis cyclic di-GMP-binding regulatory protein BcsB [Phyllobacterium ifriqiyense]|uniref:cellulose biosynthesis cyclic di-GMP-binding regulatory protein BcsB n=1 Tax=Phyllobacterium ifriqiyense TaxID=314238 RepID=UPI0033985B7B